ncbi:thiol-disulfide isomerase/thioredoxin [Chitinophaga skermanii]|uniref:Thiol-disulfide isomerase/thioredoxin n=1 Tax=Chitinophaga skermanii TaxID=331697 RepID=A0A327QS22_9BACT|nr:thioredoxin family protein [Chitinophaga skermanii]RAJ06695.1 thiol-disulfide isomerase/thioredoxin [Chitinophaga skermanii]
MKTNLVSCKMALVISLTILLIPFYTYSQKLPLALQIGDQLPANVLTYISSKLKLSSSKELDNKPLLLYFWNVHCSGCIAHMPQYDSLQKVMSEEIIILPITTDPEDRVQNARLKYKRMQSLTLQFLNADTLINKLIPVDVFPAYVWVNRKGRIISFSKQGSIESIKQFAKHEIAPKFIDSKEYSDSALQKNIIFQSTLATNPNTSAKQFILFNNHQQIIEINYLSNIKELYRFAYNNLSNTELAKDRVIVNELHGKDEDTHIDLTNYYYYQGKSQPKGSPLVLFREMIHTLNNFFGLTSRRVVSPVMCYVIKAPVKQLIKTSTDTPHFEYYVDSSMAWNYKLNKILNRVQSIFPGELPIVDESGYANGINVKFPNTEGIKGFITSLKAIGFTIEIEEKPIEIISLSPILIPTNE